METLDDRLYINVRCSVCLGTNSNRNGGICPYCDSRCRQYIEASFNHIKEQLTKRTVEDKIDIINTLKASLNDV